MKSLKEAIEQKGTIINDEIVKVDTFLNHQVDPILVDEMGAVFAAYFKHKNITKVVTVESSGIAPALMCALRLQVPMIFVKKANPSTMVNALSTTVHSFTKNKTYTMCLEDGYLTKEDNVLFIDDFLANAEAFKGVEELLSKTQSTLVGVGIVIEKAFQKGHQYILDRGYDLCTLASIESISEGKIHFCEEQS